MINHYRSLSMTVQGNKFSFICPIFDVQTTMASCVRLRNSVWLGAEQPVRKGCQACIRSSKCPASEIVRRISYGKGLVGDDHGSATPVIGKIRREILERVLPTIVQEKHMVGISEAERELIYTANDRIQKQIQSAPDVSTSDGVSYRDTAPTRRKSTTRRAAVSPATPVKPSRSNAARTGDMSAAINVE